MFTTLFIILQQFFFVSFVKSHSLKKQLTKNQEEELLSRHYNGDKHARELLIEHNLRLVAHIAKKYENKKDLQEDLISIGTIGLIKAIDSFHPDKSSKLSSYASKCIENEILMHLRTHKKSALDVSLNDVLGVDKEGCELTLLDIIPTSSIDMISHVEQNEKLNFLQTHFKNLSDIEQQIIILRFGLNGFTPLTQKDIAKKLNISRSYVSRIEKRALTKLLKMYLNTHKKNMS